MSREEAIDLLDNLIGFVEDNHGSDYDEALKMAIKALEQEPKTGHWIRRNAFLVPWKCSECNYESERYDNYCPNCGAKMVESQERSDKECLD